MSHHDCPLSASPVSCHSVIWPLLALLQLVNAVQILFPRIPTSIGTCGRCSSDADQHGETVQIAFSNQAVLMQLPFLMVSVGSLHISEVSTPAYRAISTAPPKIQLSPPVPPIPQQSPLWCQISDTRLCSMLGLSVKAEAFWPGFSVESSALNAFTCVHILSKSTSSPLFCGSDTVLFTGRVSSWNRARKCDK